MNKKINIKRIAIMIIAIGFFYFLKSQFPHYRISSTNMAPLLMDSDFVLINKFVNGSAIKNNDICVFNIDDKDQLSRIVGLPGDEISINNGDLIINGKEQNSTKTVSYTYAVVLGDHPPLAEYDIMLLLEPSNEFGEYTAEFTSEQIDELKQFKFVKSVKKIIHPKDYHYSFSDHPIFPNHSSFNWSRDNFGPIECPKKGETVIITPSNVYLYNRIISEYEGFELNVIDGEIMIDNKPTDSYTFKNNYYFAMNDNRHQSHDSRFWGFIPEENIIGKMVSVIYSPSK